MHILKFRILASAMLTMIVLSSCEDNMFLRSEKKMKREIQGTWHRNFMGENQKLVDPNNAAKEFYFNEDWVFDDERFYSVAIFPTSPIFVYSGNDTVKIDLGLKDGSWSDGVDTVIAGDFDIKAGVFKAYLNLNLWNSQDSLLAKNETMSIVSKWEFVTLESKILYLAADNEQGTSVLQREFFKN